MNIEAEIQRLKLAQVHTNAVLDVQAVVIGNLLPEFAANTSVVARLQAALEVLLEVAETERSAEYLAAARECAQQFLRPLTRH